MKKVFALLFVLLLAFSIFGGSIVVDSSIPTPEITPKSYTQGVKIPSGVRYTIINDDPSSTTYYGIISKDAYNAATFVRSQAGETWDASKIDGIATSNTPITEVDFTTAGWWYLFAVSVVNGKSSTFRIQTVEVPKTRLESYEIKIEKGTIRETYTGVYGELWASLSPDMSDAIIVYDGPLPDELLGQTVYFQSRNNKGSADSEPIKVSVPGIAISKPRINTANSMDGILVEIIKPSIYTGENNGSGYAPKESIDIYYTIDGSTPSPNQSKKYIDSFVISDEGSYTIKAIAVYRGVSTEIAETSYPITVKRVNKPAITVSGLDIVISNSSATTYYGYSKDDISKEITHYIVSEADVGKTIYIQSRAYGMGPSEITKYEVKSLKSFQELYSIDKTRQFGTWIVWQETNASGKPTGNYALLSRWPMGDGKYIITIASPKNKTIDSLIFCVPNDGSISSASYIFTNSKSIYYDSDGVSYCIPYKAYNVNAFSMSASFVLVSTSEDNNNLFQKLNSKWSCNIVASLQDEINGLDALNALAAASNSSNPNAAYQAALSNKKLYEFQFIISNEGLQDALTYYNSIVK